MQMFRKYIGAVIAIGLLAGCISGTFRRPDRTSLWEMRKTIAHLVAEHGSGEREVRFASDVEEACRLFDAGILPTLEDKTQSRVDGLRREIIEGKSWMYVSEDERYRTFYYVNLYPSMESECYGFCTYAGNYDFIGGRFDPDLENPGFYQLHAELSPEHESPYERLYEETVNRLPRIKCDFGYPVHVIDAVAVVDVIDVQLVELSGFDRVRRYPSATFEGSECKAVYEVVVDVRKIDKGDFVPDWYVIEVPCAWTDFACPGNFLYYRGMSLGIGLVRRNKSWVICEQYPVLPYPPYFGADVIVSGGCFAEGGLRDGRMSPLVVEYGHHTKVQYSGGDLVCHSKSGMFSDFGVTSKVKVLELKEGSNKKFWDRAWFIQKGDDSIERQ